ncbi:MAG: rare lipoprotein A [Candidatus Paceibacteria bacterium]|jgi:rare lipoprotein A
MTRLLIISLTILALISGCAATGIANWPARVAPQLTPAASSQASPQRPQAPIKSHTRGNRSPYNVFGETYHVMPSSLGYVEIGIASWYGKKFDGRLTSNGEVYDMYQLSAAHKSLPLPSVVRVTNLDNGRKVIVRVNDRGPFHSDRVIDLSYQTALALGFVDQGTASVVIEAIDEQNYPGQVAAQAAVAMHHETFYLQVGAFTNVSGAEQLLASIDGLMGRYGQVVDTRILQSGLPAELQNELQNELPNEQQNESLIELPSESNEETLSEVGSEPSKKVLHKVWLGPIKTETERDTIAQIVQAHNLGVPLRVKVD